jgi:CheY-like chemotaxis protein
MDKVLIVDGDENFLRNITERISKLHQFVVLTATDSDSALEILSKEPVSILVIDIEHPMIDGLELIAFMTRKYPSTPCIVMTQSGKPWFRKSTDQKEILYHLEKSEDIGYITSAILVGLTLRDEGVANKGISLASFLPLIEIEQKTCRLEISSPEKGKGFLYFEKGALIDAYYKGLDAENAASEIGNWQNIAIRFSELPRKRSIKRVGMPLMAIAGATWQKEEIDLLDDEEPDDISDTFEIPEKDPALKMVVNELLGANLKKIKAVKGYLGIGVLDASANVLAADTIDRSIDLKQMGKSVIRLHSLSIEFARKNHLTECRTLALHCPNAVIQSTISIDEPSGPFYILGITSAEGNWIFMKMELENLGSELISKII